MKKIFLFSLSTILLLLVSITGCKPKTKVSAQQETSNTTQDTNTLLVIVNATDTPVVVWITLGTTPGCLQHVSFIPYVTDSIGSLVGYFTLAAHDSTPAYAPTGMGFNGNISFGTQPLNCPTVQYPQGVNIFEFIINNSFQQGSPQETIDISCVAGVNCYIKAYLSGGNDWNAGITIPVVDSIYNAGIHANTGLTGVYPYGCDNCTASVAPPNCTTPPFSPQSQPTCNVQRNAIQSGGGLIRVVYLGDN